MLSRFPRYGVIAAACAVVLTVALPGLSFAQAGRQATPKAASTLSETFVMSFAGGSNSTTSANRYSGTVPIRVSGFGPTPATECADAFYVFGTFRPDVGGCFQLTTPVQSSASALWIDNQPASSVLNSIPSYRGDHTYPLSLAVGKTRTHLTFGVGPIGTGATWGSFTVTTEATDYTITDLGTLAGGTWSRAMAINDLGQVAGNATTATGETHAFLWQNEMTALQDLGTLGGSESYATGINSSAQVVGFSTLVSGVEHAFLWQNGAMVDLGTLGGNQSRATAINDQGQVVGFASTAAGESHAFLWQNGTMQDLGTLPGGPQSAATAINDKGVVLGWSNTAPGQLGGDYFLWQNGRMQDLGITARPFMMGNGRLSDGINAKGQIAGFSGRPFLWRNGSVTDLGSLLGPDQWSQPSGINDTAQVTCQSGAVTGYGQFLVMGCLWQNGVMQALGGLPYASSPVYDNLSSANALNNVGQVVGSSPTTSGETHAVMWTLAAR